MKTILEKLKEFKELQEATDIFGKAENHYHGRQIVYYGDDPRLFRICECAGDRNHLHGDFISCAYNFDIDEVIDLVTKISEFVDDVNV